MGPLGDPMKPLLVAMSSCAYGEERSIRDSTPLVAIEVRTLWRLCGIGMWRPVRYGESCEAWRSFEVIVCQNDWKKEPTLSAVSIGGARNSASAQVHVLRLCHGVDGRKGAQERVKGALCAVVLRIRRPPESVVCERRCKMRSTRSAL